MRAPSDCGLRIADCGLRPRGRWTLGVGLFSLALFAGSSDQGKYPTKWNPDIPNTPEVKAALEYIDQTREEHLRQWITITEIPAPSKMEQQRGAYIRREMEKAGLRAHLSPHTRTGASHGVHRRQHRGGNGPPGDCHGPRLRARPAHAQRGRRNQLDLGRHQADRAAGSGAGGVGVRIVECGMRNAECEPRFSDSQSAIRNLQSAIKEGFVPRYRVLYLKDQTAVERFRSQPPRPGPASLKPKDYALVAEIEAANEYTVWKMLQGEGAAERNLRPMSVGDVLEAEPGRLRVCRFVGFDDAVWFTFEPKPKAAQGEPAPQSEGEPEGAGDAGEASATPAADPAEIASETPAPDSPPDPPR